MISAFLATPVLLSEATPYDAVINGTNATIVIGTTESVVTLDPADTYDYFSSNILIQLTHGLMEIPVDCMDAEKGPIVDSYLVSPDAKEYLFNLKSDIKFSDGTSFNASALKWNLDRACLLNGDPSFLLSNIIDIIEVVDLDTIKINLTRPDATFLQRLTYTVAWPVSPNGPLAGDVISGDPDHIPYGLGPYMVDTWTKDTEIILILNPHYFGTAPENEKVIIKFYTNASTLLTALENGDIDVAHRGFGPEKMTSVMANDNLEYATKSSPGIRYLLINVNLYPDVNVRRALAAAINRTEIVSIVFNDFNEPLFSMVPKIFTNYIKVFIDGPDQNSVEGNMTLAGYSTTNKFDIEMWYTPTRYGDTEEDVALLLESQFEDTGFFNVTVKNTEWSTYISQFTTMGFFLLGWWFDYPDPSNYIDPFVGSGAFTLGTMYSSVTMDSYINSMLTDPDISNRIIAIVNAQKLMAKDVPCIPLFTMLSQFTVYQKNITGVTLEPSENLHYNTIKFIEEPITTTTIPSTTFPTTSAGISTIPTTIKSESTTESSRPTTSEKPPQLTTTGLPAVLLLGTLIVIVSVRRSRSKK